MGTLPEDDPEFLEKMEPRISSTASKGSEVAQERENFQPGDIVLLTDGNAFQQQWSTARVLKTYPGEDGAVRAADVRVVKSYTPEKYDSK